MPHVHCTASLWDIIIQWISQDDSTENIRLKNFGRIHAYIWPLGRLQEGQIGKVSLLENDKILIFFSVKSSLEIH